MDTSTTSNHSTSITPKRVSFGSTHGSMVETLIIDDIPQEEKNFYRQNILNNTPTLVSTRDKVSGEINTASTDNPFTQDGELAKKADYILRHSTISRSEIRISDPDMSKIGVNESEIEQTEAITAQSAPVNASSPNEIKGKENGKTVTPQNVVVEVGSANASQPQPQTAEQVKVKDKPKCKCCIIQ